LAGGYMPGFFGGRTIMKRTISEDMAVAAGAGEAEAARRPLRELMDDRLLDALLERSRDQAGGLRLTGEGSMLGELVRAVLERARGGGSGFCCAGCAGAWGWAWGRRPGCIS
jgi:hypothetical protein